MANFLRGNTKAATERKRELYLNSQTSKASSVAETDRYNGALMRTDPMLNRLLQAYTKCDENNRAELVRLAELACTAPGGIV